jgi:hypothetical protein
MTTMTRRAAIYFLFLLSCSLPLLVARDGAALPLTLEVDPVSGSYSIQVEISAGIGDRVATTNTTWLWSAETRLGDWSSEDGTLLLSDFAKRKGCDRFGPFEAQVLGWSIPNSSDIVMYTSFVTYLHDPSMIVMKQYFPTTFVNTKEFSDKHRSKNNTLSTVTLFPSFQRLHNATQSLACVSYHGVFPSMKYAHLSSYAESHLGGAPLVIYNETNPLLPAIILSPLDWPMAQHMASSPTMFGTGVKATVAEIPAGWSHQFILYAAYGISNAFEAWGDRMTTPKKSNDAEACTCRNHRLRHIKKGSRCDGEKHRLDRSSNMYRDQTHSTIGFWTDNGGYYHYSTGITNETYEEVLPQVKKYHDR